MSGKFNSFMEAFLAPRAPLEGAGGDLRKATPADRLQRILECPVCHNIPLPPIYSCVKGHIICGNCRPNLEMCALCMGKYTKSRNLALEEIISTSEFNCENTENGCKMVLSGEEMRDHLRICNFGPIKCAGDLSCRAKIYVQNYLQHLMVAHDLRRIPGKSGKFKYDIVGHVEDSRDIVVQRDFLTYDAKNFLVYTCLKNGDLQFRIYLIGNSILPFGLYVLATLKFKKDGKLFYAITVPVMPIKMFPKANCDKYVPGILPKAIWKHLVVVAMTSDGEIGEPMIESTLSLKFKIEKK